MELLCNQINLNAYNKYINSSEWFKLRQKKFTQDGKICAVCTSKIVIHVHHIRYKNLTDCILDDLLVLCARCHSDLHFFAKLWSIDLIGYELPQIKMLIDDLVLTPELITQRDQYFVQQRDKWKIQKENDKEMEKPLLKVSRKKAKEILRAEDKVLRETNIRLGSIRSNWSLKGCIKRCIRDNCSKESLQAIAERAERISSEARKMISDMEPYHPQIESIISMVDAEDSITLPTFKAIEFPVVSDESPFDLIQFS